MEFQEEQFSNKQTTPRFNKSILWFFLLIIFSVIAGFLIWKDLQKTFIFLDENNSKEVSFQKSSKEKSEKEKQKQESFTNISYAYPPVKISMSSMKKKGCATDGLLSGYGDNTEIEVAMINHSSCQYLHRALETWNAPPDFLKASKIMKTIKLKNVIYGMFLAEAIKENAISYYPEEKRFFDFKKMCRNGSENSWGEKTCKPSMESEEYRKYIKFITRRAMDLGIQSFLFGQVYYQDTADLKNSKIPEIVSDMKIYSKEKKMEIVIGAQTGDINDEKYLNNFDYIEGGVGIGEDGEIENGPCWKEKSDCWALLWNEKYSKKAKNVFLHLDWSGLKFDDMDVFSRMSLEKRAETLKKLHKYFVSRDMGFLLPMMATLDKENGGCFGPSPGFYSASRDYSCDDEEAIKDILKEK